MAVYATFFICEPQRLAAGFPGWKLPLSEPVARNILHPFTGEPMTISTREPQRDEDEPDIEEMPEYQIVSIEGDYQTYLEQRIPSFVQTLPHWCAKSLTRVEMSPLAALAMNQDDVEMEPPLYAHPSVNAGIDQFPIGFPQRLQVADQDMLQSLAKRWAAHMSTSDYTHSVDGDRVSDDWSVDEARGLLEEIVALSRRATSDHAMYLLNEW